MLLFGVNNFQPILNISKRLFYIYTTDKRIDQLSFGCMIKPSLQSNEVFREHVEKCLRTTLHQNNVEGIKMLCQKNDIQVIAIIMFYESKTKIQIKVYRV